MNITRRTASLTLAAAAGAALSLPARAAATHQVAINNFKFSPADLSIAPGDTVVFTNQDSAPHTATADNGSFDTGRLNKGASASLKFGGAGEFSYFCNFHRNMKGVIRVG